MPTSVQLVFRSAFLTDMFNIICFIVYCIVSTMVFIYCLLLVFSLLAVLIV